MPSLSTKPSSKLFLALSQAPPPEVIETATNRPLTITPSSDAPSAAKAFAFESEIASTRSKRRSAQIAWLTKVRLRRDTVDRADIGGEAQEVAHQERARCLRWQVRLP